VIVKLEQETGAPDTIDRVLRFRSCPEVPHTPVPTTVPPDVSNAKYPAVPVFPAVPDVIELAVAVPPDEAPNAVALNVSVASSVPVIEPFRAGWDPV
jgi:hypothetical protein